MIFFFLSRPRSIKTRENRRFCNFKRFVRTFARDYFVYDFILTRFESSSLNREDWIHTQLADRNEAWNFIRMMRQSMTRVHRRKSSFYRKIIRLWRSWDGRGRQDIDNLALGDVFKTFGLFLFYLYGTFVSIGFCIFSRDQPEKNVPIIRFSDNDFKYTLLARIKTLVKNCNSSCPAARISSSTCVRSSFGFLKLQLHSLSRVFSQLSQRETKSAFHLTVQILNRLKFETSTTIRRLSKYLTRRFHKYD